MLASHHLEALESFLLDLNAASAEVILPLFRADHGLENKNAGGSFDPVTQADKGAEDAIRAMVRRRFPEHGFIGEEFGRERAEAEFVWVLDPIDGTRAFIAGLPVWTTLIALRHQGAPVLGSIGQPYLGEVFIGHAGGARLLHRGGERRLAVRRGVTLREAIVASTDPSACFDRDEMVAWRAVRERARLARLGCDAYAYAMVAAGTLDLVVEAGLKCWDIEAAAPVLAGAGGHVTDWRGEPIGPEGGQVAIAGDAHLLEEALTALRPAAKP